MAWWAALLFACLPASGQLSPDLLDRLNYTCLAFAKEGDTLNATAIGRRLFASYLGFNSSEEPAVPRGTPSCDHNLDEVVSLCSAVPAGSFCLYAKSSKDDGPGGYCVYVDLAEPDAVAVPCPPGFYCTGGHQQPVVCPKGTHCPAKTAEVKRCPLGSFCPSAALNISCDPAVTGKFLKGSQCLPGPAGRTSLPQPCPAGTYCVAGRSRPCPRGSFCPTGVSTPARCSETEQCPPGSRMPNRSLRAVVELAIVLGICSSLLLSLNWWCLTPQYWGMRIVFLGLLLSFFWLYEIMRMHPIIEPITFLSYASAMIVWGVAVTPRARRACGKNLWIVEQICLTCVAAGCGLVLGDLAAAGFLAILIPFMAVAYSVFGGSLTSLTNLQRLLLLSCAYGFSLLSIFFLGYRQRALMYFCIMVLCVVVFGISFLVDGGCGAEEPVQELGAALLPGASLASGPFDSVSSPYSFGPRNLEVSSGISFHLDAVSLVLPSGQVILSDINLQIPAGATVAVMGPSGCGKSSITNVLSGRAGYAKVQGQIQINGIHGRGRSISELRSVTGFVPQDDVMHRNLTVEENVSFQAQLRLPQEGARGIVARAEQVEEATTKILDQLGLGDPQLRKTFIGDEQVKGVSGGQRKRVSIAMEFVAKPYLLFLDEPTSGLDSTTSHAVVEVVTRAAKQQRCTTIAVIHQPRYETLCLFDNVILLAAGGYLVYSGPTKEVEKYFAEQLSVRFPEKANPADIFLDSITLDAAADMMDRGQMKLDGIDMRSFKSFGQSLADLWSLRREAYQVSRHKMEVPLPALGLGTCSWGDEIFVHMKRAAVQLQRDRLQVLWNNLLLVFGLVIYCVCAPAKTPSQELVHPLLALFLLLLTQGVAAQRVFGGRERFMAWREAGAGLNTFLCFFGRDITALAEVLLATVFFTAIYWPLGPLQCSHHTVFWVSFCFVYAAFGMNYICSIFMEPDTAQMMAVVISFLSFLLAGCNPPFRDLIHVPFHLGTMLMALSPLRWAYGCFLMYDHMVNKHSSFGNPIVQLGAEGPLQERGFPLEWVLNTGWTRGISSIRSDWEGQPCARAGDTKCADFRPPNAFVCDVTQLLLLGIYFRALALLSMVITSRQKAGGGQLLSSSKSSQRRDRLLSRLFTAFLVLLTDLE
ncbi:unnamed protein product [Effrenium voratum]|nr:unnamed protein product [Effrenium voratum]